MMINSRRSAMLPAARIKCSKSILFMKCPVNVPAFLRREDATKRGALAKALAFLGFVQQNLADFVPRALQDCHPLTNRWCRVGMKPSLTGGFGLFQSRALRVAVNSFHNGLGHRKAALIYL